MYVHDIMRRNIELEPQSEGLECLVPTRPNLAVVDNHPAVVRLHGLQTLNCSETTLKHYDETGFNRFCPSRFWPDSYN